MNKICAWCGKILEVNNDMNEISHGICEKCFDCFIRKNKNKNNCPECKMKKDKICLNDGV